MAAAVEDGLLRGTDKGLLNPQGDLTRAEMAAISTASHTGSRKNSTTKNSGARMTATKIRFPTQTPPNRRERPW